MANLINLKNGGTNATPGTAPTITATTLPATGSAYFVLLEFALSGGSNVTITSITDNQSVGNTYTLVKSSFALFGGSNFLYWCPSLGTTSGTFILTVNIGSSTNAIGWDWAIGEGTGLAGTVDQTGSAQGSAVTTLTATATGANASANDLVIAMCGLGNFNNSNSLTSPPNTGYTLWFIDQGATNGQFPVGAGYKIVSATETSSGAWTWTGSGHASAIVATFPAAAGNVTVALTGQAATFNQGSLTASGGDVIQAPIGLIPWPGNPSLSSPSNPLQFISLQPGQLQQADVVVGLTGQLASFASGALGPAVDKALLGQAGTFTAGTVVTGISVSLVGQGITSRSGNLTPSGGNGPAGGPRVTIVGFIANVGGLMGH